MKHKNLSVLFVAILCSLLGGTLLLNNHYKLCPFNSRCTELKECHSFSVMTFNVDATSLSSFPKSKQDSLISLVCDVKPDVLCLQEISLDNHRMIKPRLDSIYGECSEVNLLRYMYYSKMPIKNNRHYECVGDIDTKGFNYSDSVHYCQDKNRMYVMSAEFEVAPCQWVTVFSGHLRSSAYSTARRSMVDSSGWWNGISQYWRSYRVGKRLRTFEAENVRSFIEDYFIAQKPVIVAGDLNDWCGSDCLNVLMKGAHTRNSAAGDELKDAWWVGGNGFGWTYYGWNLRLRLDHILFSNELKLVGVRVINTCISDHKPLLATFVL